MSDPVLQKVHGFWNTEACDTHVVKNTAGDGNFFEEFRKHRYRTQWHIPLLVPFAEAKGKKVLEIGIGNGADGAMFALNGGVYTGVDLTEAALVATRKHFEVLGLKGAFQKQDAEHLSFTDESFDMVYSHGVLHHTPNTQAAVDEVWRVLKPNGRAIIMLYHKRSFNYYVRIMGYMRLRVMLEVCRRATSWKTDRKRFSDTRLKGLRGNQDQRIWEVHYQNFLKDGWPYLQARNFVHHCTDGPECPVAYAFSKGEARRLCRRFASTEMKVAHFPLKKYSRLVPFGLEKWLASKVGWYLFIFASKGAS